MTRASLDKQPADVAAMFDGTAERYDLLNTLMTGGQDRRWRREVVRALAAKPGERVLDLAAGTGTSSVPFAGPAPTRWRATSRSACCASGCVGTAGGGREASGAELRGG